MRDHRSRRGEFGATGGERIELRRIAGGGNHLAGLGIEKRFGGEPAKMAAGTGHEIGRHCIYLYF